MGKLKVLPGNIANLIAAGEVVQRPASVVKELTENAVDAGATQVNVIITDAGRTLIQVIDNGVGMSRDDAVLCFERHATSKIAEAEDLSGILTYGFRGEALPSISAVGEITLKTRREKDQTGTTVSIGTPGKVIVGECACPAGSNFSVRNLFFNTPARRKFLKSDNVEFRHIVEEFSRICLAHPDIAFSLSHNGRDIFSLKKAKSLKFRILDLLGSNLASTVVDIDVKTPLLAIHGFVGKPENAKKTPGEQYFFVNGRYFRSSYLHKAVLKAYEALIPEGSNPAYFIFIDIDPSGVDVNIHPTKTEVKFEDDSVVFQAVYASVKEVLGRNSFGDGIDFDREGSVELPELGRSFEEFRGNSPFDLTPAMNPEYNPFAEVDYDRAAGNGDGRFVDRSVNYGKLFEDRVLSGRSTITVQNRYILTPASSGVLVVNVRRARERIFYDRALESLSRNGHVTQTALFPVQVNVGVQNRLTIEDNAGMLSSLGFDITPFGNDTVVVNGVPEGYSCENGRIEELVSDICAILSENTASLSELMQSSLAHKFAVLEASNAEKLCSPQDAARLLDTLFASSNSEITSDGKKISCILSVEDLDKKF